MNVQSYMKSAINLLYSEMSMRVLVYQHCFRIAAATSRLLLSGEINMKQSSYSLKPKPMRPSQEYMDWHDAAIKGHDTTALGAKHSRKMLGKQYDENMARLKRQRERTV